jgi:precorrin-6B methylase 2
VQALVLAAVQPEDVLIDLGAGLGKVVLLAHLLTGAHAHGIELQPALVERARASAARLGADALFSQGDARQADLETGTVFYLYAPFTGQVLAEVLARLFRVASKHAIVVCALGVDLHRTATWLAPRPSDSFWLTVYDSVVSGVPPRAPRISRLRRSLTDIVALER